MSYIVEIHCIPGDDCPAYGFRLGEPEGTHPRPEQPLQLFKDDKFEEFHAWWKDRGFSFENTKMDFFEIQVDPVTAMDLKLRWHDPAGQLGD